MSARSRRSSISSAKSSPAVHGRTTPQENLPAHHRPLGLKLKLELAALWESASPRYASASDFSFCRIIALISGGEWDSLPPSTLAVPV